MSDIKYITWEELLHVYEKTVDESDEDLLARIIPPLITGKNFDEELKLDIAHAMAAGELFNESE